MSRKKSALILGATALAAAAQAQVPAGEAQPAAPAAAPAYRSAFEGYRPFEAGAVQDWRQANETVRAIGGWRAYAREIQGGAKPEGRTPEAPATPADPHRGHQP